MKTKDDGEILVVCEECGHVNHVVPSAQRTGKWIDDNCSECGCYVHHGDARNYCPNCGARMEC